MASGTDTRVSKDSQLYKDYDHLFLNTFETESIIIMVEGNDVGSAALLKATDRLGQQVEPVPGVVGITSPASIIKQINYGLTGRSRVPDSDTEVREIMENHGENFAALVPDKTHMMISVEVEGGSTDQQQEDILKAVEISAKEAVFPPGLQSYYHRPPCPDA